MNRKLRTSAFLITFILVLSGCVFGGKSSTNVAELGPSLLRLTSAVQGVARRPAVYGFQSGGSGEECIHLGVQDDPSLLTPFEGYVVKAKCENKNAIVLVCDPTGKQTLFEDAGCTPGIDYSAGNPSRACEFLIQPDTFCK